MAILSPQLMQINIYIISLIIITLVWVSKYLQYQKKIENVAERVIYLFMYKKVFFFYINKAPS